MWQGAVVDGFINPVGATRRITENDSFKALCFKTECQAEYGIWVIQYLINYPGPSCWGSSLIKILKSNKKLKPQALNRTGPEISSALVQYNFGVLM